MTDRRRPPAWALFGAALVAVAAAVAAWIVVVLLARSVL